MIRLVVATALIVAGVMLAHVGHAQVRMVFAVTRNPVTIAVTGYLYENTTAPVYAPKRIVP